MSGADMLRGVTQRTMAYNFRGWGFGEAVALRGMLRAAAVLDDPEPLGYVHALLRGWIGRGDGRSPEDHVAPGRELLALYRRYGDPVFLDAARRLAELHESFPAAPSGARRHRPNRPGWRGQIWVDSLDIDAPFLVALAVATGEDRFHDLAAAEALGYCRELQEDNGLFRHGSDSHAGRNGGLWARGNGWAATGLVDTLAVLPRTHLAWPELQARLARQLDALATCQHEGGLWRTLLDRDDAYLETTLAAMVAVALHEAAAADVLATDRWAGMAARARVAVLAHVEADGALALTSDATPMGEPSTYLSRPFGVFPWGQGPLLLMLCQELA